MQPILHSKILGLGKPLLILHGLFGMGDNWITLGRRFAEKFHVHLIDLRNHGRSFHDEVMDYEAMVQDLWQYIQFYKLGQVSILGHSMGGKVAMLMAVTNPEWVANLIVADIAPKSYSNRHETIFQALQSVDFKTIRERKEVENILSSQIQNQGILQFLLKNVYHQEDHNLAFRFNLAVLYKNYALLNESLPTYSSYEGPTLFLKGENSDYLLPTDETLILAHFPNAKIVNIPRAGHWLHAENPEDFYSACLSFLEEQLAE